MRLAVTADLHWGTSAAGDAATRELARAAADLRPDALLLAGDLGEGEAFAACLSLFESCPGARILVAGNHDLWTRDPAVSSLDLYETILPRQAAEHGFHYLDLAPYVAPDGEAIVGNINWYDYSFADPSVERECPEARSLYRAKRFPGGRHNDGRFVRLGMSDEAFTARLVRRFRTHLRALPDTVQRVVAVHHHPAVRELFYPGEPRTLVQRFWLAYAGNRGMQEAVLEDPRIRLVLGAHTHAACAVWVAGRRCLNIGGDYDWKRLLLLDTATGEEQAWTFGEAERGGVT